MWLLRSVTVLLCGLWVATGVAAYASAAHLGY
jgi:hypothetical protein